MSLVNDALKRAKQGAPKSETPAVGPMRVVESGRRPVGTGVLLSMLILVILLLAGLLLWQWFHGGSAELQVRANSRSTAAIPGSLPPVSGEALVPMKPAPAPAPAPSEKTVAARPEPVATKLVAVEPAKPMPITYKLQSIVYLPGSSSAVINGKVVFVDGIVDGARVAAIGPGTATIVTPAGQTNVLAMR
ncbi:MAG TPA: hypothetical protein VFC07_08315 [Verrucomicrobiae bacterium]|nr:hypothetical protein [Verrucomicrobiae bacterium]